ncbi:MAG: hypothetical protein IT354_06175 [Gemmatimonadaceae bacterium]|nr:hypothetical protein [Gemmatimonadaceae bacterium]
MANAETATEDSNEAASRAARAEQASLALAEVMDVGSEVSPTAQTALANTAWVGDLHNSAMQDMIVNRRAWFGPVVPGTAAFCRSMVQLMTKYALRAYAQVGAATSTAAATREARLAVGATKECAGSDALSVVPLVNARPAARASLALTAALSTVNDTLVTGAYESYLNQLNASVSATIGTPPPVTSASNTVVAAAGSINAADLYVVASAANLAISSSQQWSPYYDANGNYIGGGGGGGGQWSVYGSNAFPWHLVPIIAADVLGRIAGVADGWISGERRPGYLAAKCVIWGGAASGAASKW